MLNPVQTKPWYRERALYQIYPLSFADSNGDGYGDLRGIIDHLDYLAGAEDSLGVGAIWLSPIYRSPMADFGYDVADHCAIDPRFGTMADFDELLAEAHARNLKVLLDFVPNHTSIEHAWFKESRSARGSDKRDWYIWANPKPDGSVPNNWLSRFGGSAWTLDEVTGQYYLHTFLPEQPDLNWRNPEVRAAMMSVLRFWLARGVDGFRVDAPMSLFKDVSLRNDPPDPSYKPGESDPADQFLRTHSSCESDLPPLIGSFCELLDEHPDTYLVSEAYLNIPTLQSLYGACRRHPVHAPFNFNLMKLRWDATLFGNFIAEYEAALEPEDWPNYVIGSHDVPRVAARLGQSRARLLSLIQLTLRGLPVIYNGDELGLGNLKLPTGQERDPWARRVSGAGRDPGRAPMSWNATAGGGFTTGQPWLPLSPDSPGHSVDTEAKQPDSMLELYRHLLHLRAKSPALTEGAYRQIDVGKADIFAYAREASRSRCFVVTNFGESKVSFKLGEIGEFVAGTHETMGTGEVHDGGEITLAPHEGRVYQVRR